MWGRGGREGAGASRDAWQKVKCLHLWVVHVRECVLMVPLMFVESVDTIQAFCRVCKIHVTAQRLCETSSHPDLRWGTSSSLGSGWEKFHSLQEGAGMRQVCVDRVCVVPSQSHLGSLVVPRCSMDAEITYKKCNHITAQLN